MSRASDLTDLLDTLDADAPRAVRHLWLASLLAWVRASISLSRLVLPMRRAPTTHRESRDPSRISRRICVRPKKLSPRTQLPAMKGLRMIE